MKLILNKLNLKRSYPGQTIVKLSKIKDKERIVKATREKKFVTQGNPCNAISRFLSRTVGQEKV